MAKGKKGRRLLLYSIVNAFIMLFLAYFWLSLPRTFGDEAFLIKWSSLVKKSLFAFDKKPDPNQVLFIDVSGSKTIIRDPNPEIPSIFPDSFFHRKVITDRAELVKLFQIMERSRTDIDLIVCDVLFEDSTPYDKQLQGVIQKFGDKILTVNHIESENQVITSVIQAPNATATYRSTQDLFMKYPLIILDSLKTVPLRMYELTDKKLLHKWGPWYFFNNQLSLPAPIVDFKVRQSDFFIGGTMEDRNFTIFPMGTLLESNEFMAAEHLDSYFKNKIILIGDFKNDLHNTPFGTLPGLLLIYNAYLTLKGNQHLIDPMWILFLFFSFYTLSYRIFADIKVNKPKALVRIFKTKFGQYMLNALDEMGLLIIVTLLSYLLFNVHINILILFVYLKAVEWGAKNLKWKPTGQAALR